MMADRQVFIGNLCNIPIDKLRSYCETYGTITELSLNRDKENNMYHCFAFVTFQSSRCTCQFLADRPHCLNGEQIFVKRALPRCSATVPERLIVTNRLVVQDCHKYDPNVLRNYLQKFGHIKKFDYDQGFVDFDDYDDVDRVLISRPHFIRNRELFVTKYIPSEQPTKSIRSSHHSHPERQDDDEHEESSYPSPTREVKLSRTIRIERHSSREKLISEVEDDDLHRRYEQLKDNFEKYQQNKEIEISHLKIDLERTKQQLNDLTQEKLDLLIKTQQLFHQDFLARFSIDESPMITQINEDYLPSTPNKLAKKRKLTTAATTVIPTTTNHRDYDYYS